MFLRISSPFAALALLAGCGAESPPPPGDTVDCAIGDAADLASVCTLEKVAGSAEFVIHHPDGGFRRFTRDPATGAIAPLDGAAPLVLQAGEGGALTFAVEEDRYSIPPELLAAGPE
jgi:hypothetical protein